MTSYHIIEPANLPLAKQRHLFTPRNKHIPNVTASIGQLCQWISHATKNSDGIFVASSTFLSLPPPPLSCADLGNPEFWKKHCQVRTVDTCRYQSFRLPAKISILVIPRVEESSNVVDKILTHMSTMLMLLSNRYERESELYVCAVDIPIALMTVVVRRASLKYMAMLPDHYPMKTEAESSCLLGTAMELKRLRIKRKALCKELSNSEEEKEFNRLRFNYREFRDRLHTIRRDADPPFIVCFSLVDDEPIIIWLRQHENPALLKHLPGFYDTNGTQEDARTYFWPRFQHERAAVPVPQQLCNNMTCEKSAGSSLEEDALVTFFDYWRKRVDENGAVIDEPDTEENEQTYVELKMCSKCKRAFYCSVQCQKTDYKRHKLVCAAPK